MPREVTSYPPCEFCQGTGHVPRQGGLKEKPCPACGGRGWIRPSKEGVPSGRRW